MYNSLEVAQCIKKTAKEKKFSTGKMLIDCGLSKNALSTMQSGGYMPRLESIAKIADYLGVSTDYLLGKKESRPELTERQNLLLDMFDGLNNDGQIKLLETADDMSVSGKYKKHDIVSEVG